MNAREMGREAAQRLLRTDALSKESIDMIADAVMNAFEAKIRKSIAANIRAAAPKYLDSDVDVHVWHVLDDLSNKIEHPDKENG